ncbi:MAG: glycoside hydrolase family 16 protein [Cyclobacteriaceae bacterium]|nr:glycoside hydrolase family 16 protein [Cyclobacteriaceae bacterium]MCH8515137.1 glycoside hydrolase family 16 protein [Cyclobacteriaceae bacterium]
MNRLIPILSILFLTLTLWSCDEDDNNEVQPAPPNNLLLQVEMTNEAEGEVEITFNANLSNFFRLFTGDSDEFQEFQSGQTVAHTYNQSGEFTIRVQAHTTSEVFIAEERELTIDLRDIDPNAGFESPESYEGYKLVWRDEFDGNTLSNDWVHDIGTGASIGLNGWGNNELQYYRQENTKIEDGFLIIEARREGFGGRNFTSSRIKTEGQQSFAFGRIDIRARMPYGQGIWPALWMLGDSHSDIGWPACGEIDIMEMIGGEENRVHGTLHWLQPSSSGGFHAEFGHSKRLSTGTLADQFHVFSLVWDESTITFMLDDQAYGSIDLRPSHMAAFKEKFFFIFNVAVGGNWPGSPDSTSTYPQQMVVDYVRVFQKVD